MRWNKYASETRHHLLPSDGLLWGQRPSAGFILSPSVEHENSNAFSSDKNNPGYRNKERFHGYTMQLWTFVCLRPKIDRNENQTQTVLFAYTLLRFQTVLAEVHSTTVRVPWRDDWTFPISFPSPELCSDTWRTVKDQMFSWHTVSEALSSQVDRWPSIQSSAAVVFFFTWHCWNWVQM